MLPSSVRRVVCTAPQAASAAPKAATAATSIPFLRGHQRRYSSSKPSKSDNDSSQVSAGQSVAASARGQSKAAGGDKRKRKADRDAAKKLPSVPNTHHMSGHGA